VTGGFGGVGRLVGKWLAEQGASDIALMGRTAKADHPALREIEALGACVHIVAADVADEASLSTALEVLSGRAPPLAGIFHAAADFGVATIAAADRAGAQTVLRPKLNGLIALERATAAYDLDFVVLFSSTTALLGASGFAAYAAANAFLDASAETASRHRKTISIRWGTWEAMRLASNAQQDAYRAAGLQPLPKAQALELMGRALVGGGTTPVFAKIDWVRLKRLHEAKGRRPFLSAMEAEATEISPAEGTTAKLVDMLRDASPHQSEQMLLDFVAAEVADVLETPPDAPPSHEAGLFELGMDSLMSVELKRRLERGFGARLPSTLTFNYPNIRALAGFLLQLAASAEMTEPEPEPRSRPTGLPVGTQDLDALSDEELQAHLMAVLEETK
jgi:NAD(P)-dependent dehydrogenase (short-subunit alcohol dehydrogenase family)/acyl carrier protein